jgi:hypothetical protein
MFNGLLKITRWVFRIVLWIFLVIVALILLEYITCPVYKFPEPHHFSGNRIYNPYRGIDSLNWRRANFHIHSYSWGGITDGRKNTDSGIDSVYELLGYQVIEISNYQKIDKWGRERESYIPVYEHGYGIFKNHQVVIGAGRVTWKDFPVFQNLNHKQNILNTLRKYNKLIFIAHPKLREAYRPEDMKYLTGYDGLEVLNHMRVSIEHWDSALSAGHYVTIIGDDDAHDVSNPDEIGHRTTYIHSASLKADSIIQAVKEGKAFGADIFRPPDETLEQKIARLKEIAKLNRVDISGDTLWVEVDRAASEFRFIGQEGALRKSVKDSPSALYVIQPGDTYIRTEITFPNQDIFYLNPVIRYDGNTPSNPPLARIDWARSLVFWIISWATLIFIIINILYLRKRIRKNKASVSG